MKNKGQIWSLDLILALTVLSLILIIFAFLWSDLTNRWNDEQQYQRMYIATIFSSESLLTTKGEPENWEKLSEINQSSIASFGLITSRNEISNEKLDRFVDLNQTSYDLVKRKLGLVSYEMEFKIMDITENITYEKFGIQRTGLNESIVLERFAILNSTPVIVKIEVWK